MRCILLYCFYISSRADQEHFVVLSSYFPLVQVMLCIVFVTMNPAGLPSPIETSTETRIGFFRKTAGGGSDSYPER